MKAEKLILMQRYMMKLLIGIMVASALTAAIPLYYLHKSEARLASAVIPTGEPAVEIR